MKKYDLFKLLLLLFTLDSLAGCSSYTKQPDIKHWHGKNVHKLEKEYVTPSAPSGTVTHRHGKNFHKLEKTQ